MIMRRIVRYLSLSSTNCKLVQLKNLKNKGVSSQQWLARQLSDPYVEKAKMMNYRCRSAFKLLEMDEKYKFLSPGQVVVDCGASPGSWTQVVVKKINSDKSIVKAPVGKVISIDKQQIFPIEGAIILGNMDFTTLECQNKVKELLNREKVDVVLSDMAPTATGVASLDQENIINLCYVTLRFAVQVSEIGASLVMKLWQCGETKQLQNDIERFYESCVVIKPNASRVNSAEIFLLSRKFKGLKK